MSLGLALHLFLPSMIFHDLFMSLVPLYFIYASYQMDYILILNVTMHMTIIILIHILVNMNIADIHMYDLINLEIITIVCLKLSLCSPHYIAIS